MEPKISVIVPIYNVEPYLRKCLDSIVNQTYRNLEIILVDDGSPDHCGAICEEYAERDERITVIHSSNSSAFGARNLGLERVTGDYIAFVDADDWIDAPMYQILQDLAEKNDADIVQCEIMNEGSYKQTRSRILGEDVIFSGDQLTKAVFREEITHGITNKLFRKECFENFNFDVEFYHLDAVFIANIAEHCKKLVRTDHMLYHYNTTNNSITRGRKRMKHITSMENLFEAYSAKAFRAEPEAGFFICREIPCGGRLILPGKDITFAAAIKHIKTMHKIFCRHWSLAKKSDEYCSSPNAKKFLWSLYRYCPIGASLLVLLRTKGRLC